MATSALNVFGLDWNRAADLATKQGYVQTLLGQGITPDQLKAKIGELDPANANQTAYDSLGIPSASAPATQTTGALPTAASTTQSALSNVATTGALPTSTTQGALQTTTASQPAAAKSPLSFTLPTDWGVAGGAYDEAAEKINYYNTHKITPEMLLAAGQAQSDIDWMLQHGYTVGAGATQGALSGAADTVTSSVGTDTSTAGNQAVAKSTASRSDTSGTGALAIVGDSLSSALGYDSSANAVGSLSDVFGSGVTNISRGGMTTTEALTGRNLVNDQASAFSNTGGTFQSFLDSSHPGKVVLRYGAADAAIMRDPATTISNLDQMIQMAIASGSTPVLTGIPPVVTSGDPRHGGVYGGYFDFMPPLVDQINRGMQQLANKYGLQFIDLSGVQIPNGGLLDGLHPDAATGALIANEIKRQLAGPSTVVGASGTDTVTASSGTDTTTGAIPVVRTAVPTSALTNAADTVTSSTGVDTVTSSAGTDTTQSALDISSRFYDPVLKTTWAIESAADFGLANDPRFKGQGNLVYIDPSNGSALSRDEYLKVANTPEAVSYRAEEARLAAANAKLFRPGNTLTSGFGNIVEQLGGSGYYKGVAIPTFYEQSLGDAGWLSVADQLATWKANIDKQDLSARAPFGFVETPVYTQPTGDYDPYVSGYKSTPATAFDYLTQNNPAIANAVLGHTSTGAFAYKVVNGQLKEVGHDEITPEDIAQGNAFFMLAGATGGPNRQRMSQLYRADGNDLIPVGEPKMYQGAKEQDMGLTFLDMAASVLSVVPGPWQIPAAVYKVGRAIDQGDWTQAALAAIPVIGDFANAAAIASETAQIAGAVESASFANDIVNSVTSVIPSLDSVGKVTNALQQSVSAAKALDDKNWLGLVASGTGLAGVTGAIDANTAGLIRSTANLANVLNNNGSPAQIIAAATSLANNQGFVDRATTDQVNAVASIIAAKDNPAALMGAVAQAARSGVFNETAKIGAQYEQLNSRGVIDEYNVTGGGGALISSGNPTEDEQIAIQQRQNAANQALTDYMGSGNDLSREGLVSQLQSLGLTADQAEGYAKQADQQINMQRVGADVMNRYSKIDPEFGTPQLDRNAALEEMVAAGFSSDRANEILNGIDAQNAIKLENKLGVQSAYNNLTKGTGTEEQLRRAMTSAGYTDNEINNLVTKGLGILEGSKLTAGEQAQERVSQLPDVRAEISAKPTFSEAYKLARDTYGSGATFTWQGKSYSTATAEERPDLSAAGLAAKAMSGDPQFQVALSEKAVQNQRDISQVFSDYSQKGGDLTREGALSRLESLGVTKDQASFYLDQADGKLPLLYDQFKAKVPTGSEDSYRAYIIAFNELKNKGVPTSLINVSGYGASGAKPNYPTFINAISTGFGMGAEAAGNALKAFGTVGESLGFNTAQMSDYGRRLENIAQELYPQALTVSEDEVKGRFANAKTPKELGQAIVDSVLNNPGALLKMGGVELIQEAPNIALALATGGTSALIRYSGLLAGIGLDVVESAGLQGAQKVDEGLAKGLTRAQAVKSAVDDMKAAGAVTAVMTAAADKIPFGGTVAKTLIKGSAGEGIEEYVIARATGQDHMSALRQAAFGALIGGPTEATLQGAGNLTNVTINGDTMIGTYADGTKVSISEPAGATDLKIDIIKPTDTSVNVSNALTADLSSGADLTTSINSVVSNNITADLSGTIDSTVKAVIDNGVDLSKGVTDLTSSAVANTGDTTAVINNVVSSLASKGTDLNANAGSIVTGAVSGGASVTDAVDTTLKAVTANGGNVADAAASIITSVSASGDTAQVANATTVVVNAAITSGSNVTATTSNAVDAALAASGGSTDAVTQVVGGIASQGNNDATAAAVSSAVATTGDTSAAVNAALTNGGDANTVLSTASNAAITAGTDTNTAVTNTLTSALNNNVDTTTAVNSTVKGALDAGADASVVVNSAITTAVTNNVDTSSAITNTVTAALNNNADVSAVVDSVIKTSLDNGIDTASVVTSVITAALNNNADVSQVVSTVINTAANNNADTSAVIDNAVTTAITNGSDTSAVVDSAVKTAVDAGTDSTSAIDSTLTAVANAGGDVAQAVGSAVDASLAAGADTSQTLIAATSTAITNGGDASTVVSNVVNSAVNNGASLADATASSVATAIVSGADANAVIQTLTNSNSNLAIESGSSGDVTTVLASDGTSNTQVTMDAGSQTVTTTTTDTTTGETKQVTIQGDTTTTVTTNNSGVTTSVTVDESTGVKTEITSDAGSVTSITTDTTGSTTEIKSDVDTGVVTQIVSNPDRDQIVTTTWNADNTVTVTTKSGDGPEATETLTADVAPVKPKLDPIAAVVPVQAAQATKTTAPKAAAPKASFKLPSAAASGFGLSMPMASSDYDLGVLKSSGDTRIKNPLEALMERVEQMNQIDPMLAAVMSQRLGIQPQQAPTFTYGQETSIDDILGLREPKKPEMEEALYAEGGYVEPLRAKGGAMNLQFMNRGGVLPGGREDFKDGKHVAGDGDGQSDDIPAWLADGEFVFPADVVSALGNGSTKAGTDKLYKMMHEIRARARSTKVKDLPPPAHKSPLDYIKKGK